MRVPTVTQFQEQSEVMSAQMLQIQALQQKAETGTKLQNSSDDPVLASQIKAVKDYIQSLGNFDTNGKLAQNRYSLFSNSLQSAIGIMEQVRELTQSAQSDTLNNDDRNNIANELQSDLDQLVAIANTQDGNGSYIYSGYSTNTPPYVQQSGQYVYQGGYDSTSVYISPSITTPYNQSGFDVFGAIDTGNGSFTITAPGTNTGTATTSAGSVVSEATYVQDTYTISYVTNSSGQLAYQIVGASSGQVVPAPPATVPADAPAFVADSDVTFNGLTVSVAGLPNVGDSFQITPSTSQNMFNTLQQMITTLRTPINTPTETAAFHQNMTQSSAALYEVSDHLRSFLSQVGSNAAQIDSQVNTNDETITNQKIILGQLADVDMTEVTSSLMQQNIELQATQEIYIKIQETLFQLLRNSTL
jgi:flagellar hook-associated protein 3 FlgL